MAKDSLIVQKFGGTSVGTPERVRGVAKRIAETRAQGHRQVVVVSAMGHTTDELIELAHRVSQSPPHREMDMLLTAGERISMALLSMALADLEIPAVSFTGSQSGIITDSSHRRARIKKILGDRVRATLQAGQVAIVAGFQGVSESKEITTLGRGGSDTTAVALAAALQADLCEIYTDVDGVYSADPRVVPEARLWRELPHDLMVEMAVRGAGVLHPRSIELAKQFGVSVCVRNSLNQHEGTRLVSRKKNMEDFKITGVTAASEKMLVRVELERPGAIGAVWDRAAENHLGILGPVFSGTQASFFTDRESEADWRKILTELGKTGFVKAYEILMDQVPLSVVGDRFAQDGGALGKVLEVLARNRISVTMGSASALAITVSIPLTHVKEGVQALHQEFFKA